MLRPIVVVSSLLACVTAGNAQKLSETDASETMVTSAEIDEIEKVLGVESGETLKRISSFCTKLMPEQPGKVQEVEGYVYLSSACSVSSSCLSPFLKGYRYVEFEASDGVLGRSLPVGKYRIESRIKPDPACTTFQRFFEEDHSVTRLKKRYGESFCLGLLRVDEFESEFAFDLDAQSVEVSNNISLRIVDERVVRRSDEKVIGQQKRIWIDDEEARWGLHCESPKRDIAEIVIPPFIPAKNE